MFLLGVSSSFIPYLLLSLATLVCYVHDHKETSAKPETTVTTSTNKKTETTKVLQLHQHSQPAVEQVLNSKRPTHCKEISASIFSYTGLPLTNISSQHPLRAPPSISSIFS